MVPPIEMNDGRTVPPVGFGTFPHGGDDSETTASTNEAGYRLLDTALATRTRRGSARRARRVARDELFVTTKIPAATTATTRRSRARRILAGSALDCRPLPHPLAVPARRTSTSTPGGR